MEKMIVTEYGRPIMMQKVKEFTQRTMFLADERVIPYEVFALLDSGELVNVGNFDDLDTAEISQIILDIFTEDKKAVFDVNLEVFGIKKFLEMLRYVSADSDSVYRILINELKQQLKSGELDVSGYIQLAHAIVAVAAESYKYTLLAVKNHTRSDSVFRRKEELESFFLSEWFALLSGLDGRYFIQKMQEVYYFDR